jgi:ABC-type multidrug transport system ATPase subunit
MSKQINKKTLISIDGITKKFGKGDKEFTAVDKLTFNIAEGENIALIGANGAGKTTTIEMILGINKPNEGKISYKYTDS